MAERLTKAEQFVGKTVRCAILSSQEIGFQFDDGSWFFAEADTDWDQAYLNEDAMPSGRELIELGVKTKDEVDAEEAARHAEWKQEQEQRERKHYEELRKKFEVPQP